MKGFSAFLVHVVSYMRKMLLSDLDFNSGGGCPRTVSFVQVSVCKLARNQFVMDLPVFGVALSSVTVLSETSF
jgi:hypothetical protein